MPINLLNDRDVMLNREIGLIQFYRRILSNALNKSIPLLERLSYLCIVSRNCDELFEVRIARLLKWNREEPNKILPDGLTAAEALLLAQSEIVKLHNEIYNTYHNCIIPDLNKEEVYILEINQWNKAVQQWAYSYFINDLKPVLTPIGIDPAHPFPRVPNKNLHFAVELDGKDQFGRDSNIAIVEAPRILPRVIKLPEKIAEGKNSFILLQDIIKLHVDEFFYGLTVRGCYPFRVTRAADIFLRANAKNIRFELTQELQNRKYAQCSRLELDISGGTPNATLTQTLLSQFNLTTTDLYLANGPVNLSRLLDIVGMVNRPKLKYVPFTPGMPAELFRQPDIFKAMDKGDILIHTPYQSFDPVVELTKRAATDPDILAIKMTVYRTGVDSELAQNLIKAARAGKQVVASVELFARFDEEANVEIAKALEEAGAHVVYGVMGYKVHAKMLLVVRKYGKDLRQYVHLGTGNYHQITARAYSDFGILSTRAELTRDIDNIFAQITGIGRAGMLNIIYQAPFTLHDMIMKSIDTEIDNALNGKKALIQAKMNSLLEPQVIRALYRASGAGVKIRLIVRGSCALRPKIPGISDNIEVRSVVGRFLEHHRIFYFYCDGEENTYLSSADWMRRNFFSRVETCVPIIDKKIKKRIIQEGLTLYWQDNVESWVMQPDGTYRRRLTRGQKISAQFKLMEKLGIIG
ncbi:MAG: ppk1 [Burkholderiales bacterium]|jgi:polyphosphate kinase|nr:ppk1 [Burkholderiales bacterium]